MSPGRGRGHVSHQSESPQRNPAPLSPGHGSSSAQSSKVKFREKAQEIERHEGEARKSALRKAAVTPQSEVTVIDDDRKEGKSSTPERVGPASDVDTPRRRVDLKARPEKGKSKGTPRWQAWPRKGKGRKGKGKGKK